MTRVFHKSSVVFQWFTLICRCCRVSICCSRPAERVLNTCSTCDLWLFPHTHRVAVCYPDRRTSGPSPDLAPRPPYNQRSRAQRSRFIILCLHWMRVKCCDAKAWNHSRELYRQHVLAMVCACLCVSTCYDVALIPLSFIVLCVDIYSLSWCFSHKIMRHSAGDEIKVRLLKTC